MSFDDSDPLPVGSNVTEGACETMPRLTITLTDRTHRALKKAAARQGRSMSSIIEESLEMRGIWTSNTAWEVVAKVRARSGLDADAAMALAVEETARHRTER